MVLVESKNETIGRRCAELVPGNGSIVLSKKGLEILCQAIEKELVGKKWNMFRLGIYSFFATINILPFLPIINLSNLLIKKTF